jgi:hypothetical protein
MFNRMTIWAQHLKISQVIVFSVAVFMMYAKNFRVFVVSALNALGQQAAHQHVFSHGGKIRFPLAFARFVNTCHRAIFSFCRRRVHESYAAMNAVILHSAFFMHRLVVTLWATVFGFVGAARNVLKNSPALHTVRGYLLSGVKCHTLATTKQRRVFAVLRHSKYNLTMLTRFFVPNSGANHATH